MCTGSTARQGVQGQGGSRRVKYLRGVRWGPGYGSGEKREVSPGDVLVLCKALQEVGDQK